MTRSFTVVDLFSGCGGLTAGFLRANSRTAEFRPIAAVDFDIDSAATYAANFGDHVFLGDIGGWLSEAHYPTEGADVVLGGPPCQGFSLLGKQEARDARNALWQQYVGAVDVLQPTFFVLENVAAFRKSEQFDSLARACDRSGLLRDYEIEPFILDASLYGAPQRRRRAIVIGRRRGLDRLGPPPARTSRSTVRDAFRGLRAEVRERDLPARTTNFRESRIPGPFSGQDLHVTRWFTQLSMQRYRSIPPGGNRFDIPYPLLAPCWRTHRTGSADVMGRLHWDRPSVTIRTEFHKPEKGRYLHPTEHRPITHLEAARLQGFPDDYQWFGSKYSIARQIGNAVPLQLGEAIGCHTLRALCASEDLDDQEAA